MTPERHLGERNALCGLIAAIRVVGDREFQRRIWVRGEGPEVSSHVEITCQIFDDYGVEATAANLGRSLGLNEMQCQSVRHFADALRRFDKSVNDAYDDPGIVGSVQWGRIVSLAMETSDKTRRLGGGKL